MRVDPTSPAILLALLVLGLMGVFAFQVGVFSADPSIDPRPYPDKPENLTKQRVGAYAQTCERAIGWNRLSSRHDGALERISISMNDGEVTNQAGAWTISIEYEFSTKLGNSVGDGRGATVYVVDESATLRDGGGPSANEAELAPTRNGTVITNC